MITTPWDLIDKIKSLNYFRSTKSIIGAFFRLQISLSRCRVGWVLIAHAPQLTPQKKKTKTSKIGKSLWPQVHVKNRIKHNKKHSSHLSKYHNIATPDYNYQNHPPQKKKKRSTLAPQYRKRVLSHREQKRQVNMTRGDFHPWNWLVNIS